VISQEGKKIEYGLGLHRREVPACGTLLGHDGSVWGGGAITMASADGEWQMSVAVNLQRWNALDSVGKPRPHAIDTALTALHDLAMCGHGHG
jgi:D-alanyl-D-alanine carboxypeptidase